MYTIATYGSLKKGFHNHAWLGDSQFLGTTTIKAVMQIPGTYPHLFHSNEIPLQIKEVRHKVEIYLVDPETFKYINNIELSCGYVLESIETPFGEAAIWMTNPHLFDATLKTAKAYTLSVYNKLKQNAKRT